MHDRNGDFMHDHQPNPFLFSIWYAYQLSKYLRIRTLGRLNSFNDIGLQLELTRTNETGICPRMTFSKYIQS